MCQLNDHQIYIYNLDIDSKANITQASNIYHGGHSVYMMTIWNILTSILFCMIILSSIYIKWGILWVVIVRYRKQLSKMINDTIIKYAQDKYF